MTITIEQLRVRVGLDANDTSKDADIILVQGTANSLIEAYLDRWLTEDAYIEQFTHEVNGHISLRAYPIVAIDTVMSTSGRNVNYHVNIEDGLVFFDGISAEHQLTIEYVGGYGMTYPMPPGIELAILLTFDQVWAGMTATADNIGVMSGVVKSIAADGANISFDTSASGSASDAYDTDTGLPGNVIGMLRFYRREFC
jgi:hypothetical protein